MKIFLSHAVENYEDSSGEHPWLIRGSESDWSMENKTQQVAGGTPLIIKSNLKYNMGLIRVFEIYSINYCFFNSTLQNWHFLHFFSAITFL